MDITFGKYFKFEDIKFILKNNRDFNYIIIINIFYFDKKLIL